MNTSQKLLRAIEESAFEKLVELQVAERICRDDDFSEIAKEKLDKAREQWQNASQLLVAVRKYIDKEVA